MQEELIYGQKTNGKWYVRPVSWAGVWSKDIDMNTGMGLGKLSCGATLADFATSDECQAYILGYSYNKTVAHNYENCHNMSCKRKSEKVGMLLAYQSLKEKMDTIKVELSRKGLEEPKDFSVLEELIEDNLKQLN